MPQTTYAGPLSILLRDPSSNAEWVNDFGAEYVEELTKKTDEADPELFEQLAEGLQAIHDADLIHQDLKPANCAFRSRS